MPSAEARIARHLMLDKESWKRCRRKARKQATVSRAVVRRHNPVTMKWGEVCNCRFDGTASNSSFILALSFPAGVTSDAL